VIGDLPYFVANRFRLARLRPLVKQVNELEGEVSRRSDREMRGSAAMLRRRLSEGETLDDVLPEAFALVREAARRHVDMRHYDVQVLGALAMHSGCIAEMQTGEGKTLAATMPAFLHALRGRGVHVVTTNDYLAQRDADWMGDVYRALGLTVGCLVQGLPPDERVAAYRADITYGTNREFAFDYLRDLLRAHAGKRRQTGGVFERMTDAAGPRTAPVQREHHFAIVDEVDSILIDEARVPLIISSRQGEESPYRQAYAAARKVALQMQEDRDYFLEPDKRRAQLTVQGLETARAAASGRTPPSRPFEHLVEQALRAEHLFERDREYLVKDDEVCIVDEFTGRMMPERAWSLGLHQAIETKEGVTVKEENRTEASVTFQRYFRLYSRLAGMTGTARSSRREFRKVFDLPVVTIPTNKPLRRTRLPYRVFPTWEEKFEAIMKRIVDLNRRGRPVLVGTRSVQRSEQLSRYLSERDIDHCVLNARNHAEEAELIARAGQPGRVTISTNMAGRGVDIVLGDGVAEMGGLHVLGTEIHEARRIDRQLGGRAGRQGDPGSYQFYVSLEDEILVRWSKTIAGWLSRVKWRWPAKLCLPVFRLAQHWIERRHLRIRVDLLEHDEKLEEMKGSLGVPVWG
jgi:preprotein translocase subunit SecA